MLQKIFEFSGYTTSISLNTFRDDISKVAIFYKLKKLMENGYLREILFFSDSDKDVLIYQVTAATCKLFGNPDSHFRKKHQDTYIIRALIKQHFLFEISKDFNKNIISSHDERVKLLTHEVGFASELLPRKYNKSIPMVHVEECIIDGRNIEGKELYCNASNKLIYNFNEKRIVFVYVDKYQSKPSAQLLTLLDRYNLLLDMELVRIDFLIIVDSESREKMYEKSINSWVYKGRSEGKSCEIHESYINLHYNILRSLNVPGEILNGFHNNVKEKYSQAQVITEKDFEDIPLRELRSDGIKVLKKM